MTRTAFDIVEAIAAGLEDFEFETVDAPNSITVEKRVRSFRKASDIKGFTIHVMPLPPETETVDRDANVATTHQVAVFFFDRRDAGTAVDEFAWHKTRASMLQEVITKADWKDWLSALDGCVPSELESGSVVFDGVDSSTVFAQVLQLSVEDSE